MIRYIMTSILIIMVMVILIIMTASLLNILNDVLTTANLSGGVMNGIGGFVNI